MIKNFFVVAFRNLVKRKGYSLLNTFGLASGITCCLLIFEYVAYQKSYDNFHEKADRVFRIQGEEYQNGQMAVPCASVMPALAPALKREFPEVEDACRLNKDGFLLANDVLNIKFDEENVYYADASILKIFHLPLLQGDPETALTGPGKIILSATDAQKYFPQNATHGKESPIGKTLTVYSGGKQRLLNVTGVFRDYPANSHLKFNFIVSYPTYSQVAGNYGSPDDPVETKWNWTDFYTYILLRQQTNLKQFESKLSLLIDKYYNNLPENKNSGERYHLSVMPLKNIHLYSHYTQEAEPNGDGQSVSFLFLISFLIIAIAWINYINLATSRSMERAREVGIRKVMGAAKKQLVFQFMMESLLFNIVALSVAIGLTVFLNPFFKNLTGNDLKLAFQLPASYWRIFATLFVMGTFFSGIYPALVLSRYNPVVVLKGLFKNSSGGQWMRKSLIVTQFIVSIVLIAGTMIIYRQVSYMRNQQLGFKINQTVILEGASAGLPDSSYHEAFQVFKDQVLRLKGVENMTASSGVMGREILWSTNWQRLHDSKNQAVNLFHLGVDDDFIDAYNLRLIAGRDFSKNSTEDKKSIIVNESAVHALGIRSAEAAIGDLVSGGQRGLDSMHIVGVIADYHHEGLQKAIQPLVLLPHRDRRAYYSIKLQSPDARMIASIKTIWDRQFPGDPFSYFFLDEFFNRQYGENQRFGKVFGIFALLAIAIACIGLMGLSAYNVIQRTKEIGIRKVLGASVQSLLYILAKDFLTLITIAFLIAVPVTWFAMNSWLQTFAYRLPISGWVFVASGVISIFITVMIVAVQALKTILANPVKALRTE